MNSASKDVSHDDIRNAMTKLTTMIEKDKRNLGFEGKDLGIDSSPERNPKFKDNYSDEEGSPDVDYLNEVIN